MYAIRSYYAFKFEAGTTNYVGAVSLGAAIDYLNEIGIENIQRYESELIKYATEQLSARNNFV